MQQDNELKNISESTSEWLKKKRSKDLKRPSQTTDLNPSEILWWDIKRKKMMENLQATES